MLILHAQFTSDIYPPVPVTIVEPIFDSDDFDIPNHEMSTVANPLYVSTLHDYFGDDLDDIEVNAVAVVNDDSNAICVQFDSSADVLC